ncbi:hypothetical protein TNCV_4693811 [Trichonephila clavipes]|uniref:Uncharacterized protein n=1 Tax=Trichonephila clavipes TaxID=2585209 RepID=A0A8X6WAQ9_TRICX|nr:hypothetical protein TNCV_4693811 [Trichonephila clavipes]
MKCMHLGEKTRDKPTQRDKPSNLGVKSREQANSSRQDLQSRCVKTTTIDRKSNKQMFLNMVYALPSLQWLLRTVSAYSETAGATFLAVGVPILQ